MKKAGAKKHMTLDLLAEAMQAGFSQLDERIDGLTLLTARQFDQVDERLDRVEGSVLGIRRDMLAFHDKWSEHENRITSLEEKSI